MCTHPRLPRLDVHESEDIRLHLVTGVTEPKALAQAAADQLREPAALSDDDDFDSQLQRPDNDNRGRNSRPRIRAAESMPELSLLDRQGAEGDDTIPPDLDADDLDEQGSHTRLAAGLEPEPRADANSRTSDMRPKAPLQAAARSMLDRGAGLWRRVAHRLQRHGT